MLLATIWLCSLAQIPTNGLVQRFTFDGTLDGINGNTLSLFGQANYVNDRFSTANSAQNLANTATSFNTASLTNLPTGNADRTVCFWYKSNANATHSLFNYGNNYGATTFAIAYTTSPTRLVLFDGSTEYSRNITYTGTWTHVAVVHSAGNSYIYLNGVQQGAAIAATFATATGQTVNIGFSPGGTPYANFQMDELLVYNRALTSGEVVNVYNACNSPVSTTPSANQNICTGSSTTLSASGANISWYTTTSGGSPIAITNSFTTGVLTANTTYYAESAGCAVRTAVPVTVSQSTPAAPTNTSQAAYLTRCSGATSILTVSSSDSVRWYNVPTGGTALGTGNTFVTPPHANPFPNLTSSVTYYAEAWNACGTSTRTAINITVKATPATPVNTSSAADTVICTGGSTTLSVSSTSGTVEWSTISVTPSTVATGLTYTTPALTQTTQYAVYSSLNGCFSNELIVTVNVSQSGEAAPSNNTSPAALSVCSGNTTSLAALSSSGSTLYWYTAATGGTLLGTGSPFTTPVITDTTTFYVQAGQGTCASTRTAITVTTKFVPTGVIQLVNDTIRASNLYSSYVLRKDTTVIASSNTTGSFAIPATQCGDYQATFTNPTNNCPNVSVNVSKAYVSAELYCEARVTLSGVTFPVTYSMNYTPNYTTPTIVDNAAPLNFRLTTNLTTCSAVSGMRYVSFKTGTGCIYNFSFDAELPFGQYNTTVASISDSITTCPFTSNILTVNTINLPAPTNTTAAPWLSICSGSTTTLSASGSGTLYWYDVPTGGTALGSGPSFNTPALTANKTYYVQSGSSTCASPRTSITVTVNSLPSSPVSNTPTANLSVCSGNSTVLSVTPAGAGISTFWSLFPQGGSSFAVGNSVTIPASSLTATDTFYVGHVNINNNCNSALIPIIVTVKPTPAAPANTTPQANQSICPGTTTTLSASGTGTLEWYAASTGGNALATGSSFSTPAINTATSYFVAANNSNGCSSARTEVQVQVNPAPPAPNNTTATANLSRCVGNTTTLTATTTFAGAQLKWYDVATGGTSLATGGTFTTPVLTATDAFYVAAETSSCPSLRTAVVVTVNPIPTASISPATLAICSGATATLTASGGGTYSWSYSGGSAAQATFNPTSNTTYTVTVTAAGCSATATRIVTVNALPTAAITPATISICSGESAQLTASGGSYTWSNSLGTNANVTVSPTSTTAYNVTVTNANNCSATATRTVTVNSVTASINGPTTICSGLQATLTANGGSSYAWSNSLGTSASVTVSPTANTTYTVTVTGAGNCTATASQTVSVQNAPTAVITGNTTICSGESATLTANGGNTYTWGNGLGSNAAITVSPTSNTTYTVTVSIGANCTATATETVTVNQPSASSFSQTVCNGETFIFGGNTLTAGGVYYDTLQNIAGCDSIVTLNLNILPLATATLSATICTNQSYEFDGMQLTQEGQYFDTLQTQAGCDSFVVLNLSVVSQLTSSYSAAICQGESYDFNGQALTTSDVYTATLTSTSGCDSIVTLTLTVNTLPVPSISANGNVLSTQSFDSYQWQLDANDIQGANAQTYTALENGNYTVWVSDDNGCEAVSSQITVTGVGIKGISQAAIKVYPNPAEDVLVIEMPAIDLTKLTITDMEGRILMEQYVSGKQTLDISSLPAGVLNIQFNTSTGIATSKLVKLK